MRLLHVIPISKSMGKETLSYFTTDAVPNGSLITVPLRRKEVPALVLSGEEARDAKSKIKSAQFQLKKIGSKKPVSLLTPECIQAAQKTAEYFASTTGTILHAIIPKVILENAQKTTIPVPNSSAKEKTVSEKLILQAETEERFTTYKSLIREEFARKSSVFLCVPTIIEGTQAHEKLKKGIEHRTFLLHGSLTKGEIQSRWKNALQAKHPVLLIATAKFLSLPRADIKTIIIERENAPSYKTIIRPFFDFRIYAEFLAQLSHARLIRAGLPLQIETMWRYRQGEYEELAHPKFRVERSLKKSIIDMREKPTFEKVPVIKKKREPFTVISKELRRVIKESEKSGGRVFIFCARRGLSSLTVCRDCGNTVTCEICDSPVTLHRASDINVFVCHTCSSIRSAKERCQTCSSWKLESLGIGIQRVESEIRSLFPEKKVITVDRDTTKTHKQVITAIEKFYGTPGSILLGTEMSLIYLQEPVEHTAIASVDSLLSLPEWRIQEKLFSLLLAIEARAKSSFIIQTRKPNVHVLLYALNGNVIDFYREEIENRKKFHYPPFSVLIKLTALGTSMQITKEIKKLEALFKDYALHIYSPLTKVAKVGFAMHALLRVKRSVWPDKKLLNLLRALPPNITVTVDPENLF